DAESRRAARPYAAQLIGDALVHPLDLARERVLQALARLVARRELGQKTAHRREGRLQAVGEVVEHVAVADEPPPLGLDQRVQVTRERHQLGRELALEPLPASGLDLA